MSREPMLEPDLEVDSSDEIDGRVARRERNRDSIIDAIMVLIHAGEVTPNFADVAALAGVSERSIFRHFDTREALLAAVIERQMEVVASLVRPVPTTGSLASRVEAFVAGRARVFEATAPVRRASVHAARTSDQVSRQMAENHDLARFDFETVFSRELDRRSLVERRDLVAGLNTATSWESWDLLRTVEGCSVARARRVLERMLNQNLGEN